MKKINVTLSVNVLKYKLTKVTVVESPSNVGKGRRKGFGDRSTPPVYS